MRGNCPTYSHTSDLLGMLPSGDKHTLTMLIRHGCFPGREGGREGAGWEEGALTADGLGRASCERPEPEQRVKVTKPLPLEASVAGRGEAAKASGFRFWSVLRAEAGRLSTTR